MEQSVKERVITFLRYKGLSQSKFEKACGLSNGYVSNIRDGIGSAKLSDISKVFPELNTEWIVRGEGEMLNRPAIISTSHITDSDVNIAGTSLNVTKTDNDLSRLTDVIERQSKQIDRLLSIIEKMQN